MGGIFNACETLVEEVIETLMNSISLAEQDRFALRCRVFDGSHNTKLKKHSNNNYRQYPYTRSMLLVYLRRVCVTQELCANMDSCTSSIQDPNGKQQPYQRLIVTRVDDQLVADFILSSQVLWMISQTLFEYLQYSPLFHFINACIFLRSKNTLLCLQCMQNLKQASGLPITSSRRTDKYFQNIYSH